MKTLFPSNYNWGLLILTGLILRVSFFNMSLWSFVAIMVSLWQFSLLFNSIGHILPTRHLLSSFMCIQFFIGPSFAYNGLDQYQYFKYQMRIPESQYFAYAIPAVLFFIIGLHISAGKYKGEIVDKKGIELFVKKNPGLPYIFIVLGFFASVLSGFFGSELAFVFYLLGSFKFIGLFLLVLGSKQLKLWPMVIVIGSIISSSFTSGMFHDLITWIIFSAAIFALKYKFSFNVKLIGLLAFIFIALTIQILKSSFREVSGTKDLQTFADVYQEKNDEGGVFSFSSMAKANVRINQGFIITNIMQTVPEHVPFADGEEMNEIIVAAVMPRIFAPNKLKAGDRTIFAKYSGIPVAPGTSMGLSSLGDAYVNYGTFGGVIFMFILGFFYSEVLKVFQKESAVYPVLILFVALVFYYPIRPDCELQTILGHVVKACFLIFVMIQVWKFKFRVNRIEVAALDKSS